MRRFWVRPSLQLKRLAADMLNLAKLDDEGLDSNELIERGYFRSYTRMPIEIFQQLLIKVEPFIKKQKTNYRQPISAVESPEEKENVVTVCRGIRTLIKGGEQRQDSKTTTFKENEDIVIISAPIITCVVHLQTLRGKSSSLTE
ncbi:hypothetical protein V9T40_003410 [Parthenolecanium corni]|uniref:Uncharacterized protein n=1 Tax=Parthenolecanium corni TaxID=536013 RepID=A0AAN9Y8U7_9HEMI